MSTTLARPPVETRPEPPATRSGRVLVALAALWLLVVVVHRLLTGRFWLWVLPDLIPPIAFLVVPLVLLVVVGLLRRPAGARGRLAAILVAVALVLGAGQAGLNVQALRSAPAVAPGSIHVFSWNTEYWDQTDDPASFYRFLTAQKADVYVLQEYLSWSSTGPQPIDDLAGLRRAFPGYQVEQAGELVTLSRFPIASVEPITPAGTETVDWAGRFDNIKALRTDLITPAGPLSVYNVHIPVQLGEKHPLRASFYADVHARVSHRAQSFGALEADALQRNPGRVLISGDFNSTPAMGEMSTLRAELTDAGSTPADRSVYPVSWNARSHGLWRLDWAFGRGLDFERYRFVDSGGMSDHRAQDLTFTLGGTR